MHTKITVISDNIPADGIRGEWGLSMMVQHDGKRILIDAGASDLFAENLKKLGFDIKETDHGVLSHAHYDHSNGIPAFFAENSKAKFYFRETAAENCYFKKFFITKYIGIPNGIDKRFHDRIVYVSGDYRLCDGVYLIPHKTAGLGAVGKREMMYRRTPAGWIPDDFSHEQSVVIETEKGLVIINSCSHGGAVNIINEVKASFPDKKIYGLIGGFHLFNKSRREIENVAREIRKTGIGYVCTGHCTKDRAYKIMKKILGSELEQFRTGLEMEF